MIGFAPRGRSELRLLLDVGDLDTAVPSTLWDRTEERTWRTGIAGDDQPRWQAAAHAAGSVTAYRAFTSEDGHRLGLLVVPLAAAGDAAEALADLDRVATRPEPFRTGDPARLGATHEALLVVVVGSGPAWEPADLAAVLDAQLDRLRGTAAPAT